MARPDQIEQLDRRIAAAVESAVQNFRDQLADRLRSASAELSRAVDDVVPALPASFLSTSDVESLAEPPRDATQDGALQNVIEGARRIDEARGQSELLEALLLSTAALSSRAGVFLIRGDELRGWRGVGFGEGTQDLGMLLFDVGETPWTDLASGTGCVPLSAGDCARIGSRLEAPLAHSGALIPLVLRDQVAAVLYADRLDEHASWSLDALQLLTHLTALAIETLPFRERQQTPTLRGLGTGDGLAMWTGAAAGATAMGDQESTAEAAAETPAQFTAPAATEEELWPEPEATADTGFEEELTPTPERYRFESGDQGMAEEAAAEPTPSEALEPERPAAETSDAYWLLEDVAAPPAEEPREAAPIEPTSSAPSFAADFEMETAQAEEEAAPTTQSAEMAPPPSPSQSWTLEAPASSFLEPPPAPPDLPMAPSLATMAMPSPVAPPPPGQPAAEDDATLLLQRPRYPEPAPTPRPVPPYSTQNDEPTHPGMRTVASTTSPIPVPPPPRTWQPGETAEVAPPPDLQGPGWAFATSRVPIQAAASGEDQAVHDEARRLARLLVSEIKLYNEERVEEGRRNRDLYERLKEDIDRSRQMYEERVDTRVSKNTDYFYQELVRILAAGDAKALGI